MIDFLGIAATAHGVTAQSEWTLRLGVHASIGGVQRSEQEYSALKALGVAERRYGDVESCARPRERRKGSGDHHRGHVAYLDGGGGNLYSQPLQDIGQRLGGELGLLAIARALQPDHDTVTNQGIFPDALDGRDVTDQNVACVLGQRSTRSSQTQKTNEQ